MTRFLVILVLAASSAYGEIYTWTDSRGTAHYTNSEYEIPVRYRPRAKVLDLGIEKKTDPPSPQLNGESQPVKPLEQATVPDPDERRMQQQTRKARGRNPSRLREE